jgi:hypothetical protein
MATTTTAADLTKLAEVTYTPTTIQSLALKDTPLTAWLPKTKGGGKNVTTRLLLQEATGQGVTLTQAIADEQDPGIADVIQSWKKFYTSFSLDNDAIEQSEKNAAIQSMKLMFSSTLRAHGDKLETALWGNGSGALGRAASISTDVVTLANPSDVFNFEVGMTCVFDDTATGASLRTGEADVESIQYSAGTVTFDDMGDVTSEGQTDYIFHKNFENGAGPIGILAWLTDVAATGDAFGTGSFDRYPYGERAAGWKFAGAGMTNREAIIHGLSYGKHFGGRPDVVFGNTKQVAKLVVEMQNHVQYDGMTDKKFNLNFRGVKLAGPQGDVLVMGAQKCPENLWVALTRESWSCNYVGDNLVRNPIRGGKFIDSEAEDSIRGRWKSSYVLECPLPGWNGRITMS